MNQQLEEKEEILEAAIQVFNEKGIKFTMDDLAKKLGMSKKTIYKKFNDKQELFSEMVDYFFDGIKKSESEVVENDQLDVVEKLIKVLTVLPDRYATMDYSKIAGIQERLPNQFDKVVHRLETGWEPTIALIEEGIKQGKIRNVSIVIIKMMIESSIAHFLESDMLEKNGITYLEALDVMNDIIMRGILVNHSEDIINTDADKTIDNEDTRKQEEIDLIINLKDKFIDVFDCESERVFFAPGRVNLIGEHIDYNGGNVLPCALTVGTYAIVKLREDGVYRLYSDNFKEDGIKEVTYDDIISKCAVNEYYWRRYVKGVIWAFDSKGFKADKGMDILFYGNIPNKSGLSSSASIEVLTGKILIDLYGFDIDMKENALICQCAEREYVGVNCGIMDQFAIAMGRRNAAIYLNTDTLEYEYTPLNLDGYKIVIGNTNKKRGLSDSKYNERRAECENALECLQSIIDVNNLCELKEKEFELVKGIIKDEVIEKRAKHVVSENERTKKAVKALKKGKLKKFGKLMNESHNSLKNDYEVTGNELDTLVEEALKQEGVLGSRMTGAGFGGCTVSLVKSDKVNTFIKNVSEAYKERIGYMADFYVVEIGDGPQEITL